MRAFEAFGEGVIIPRYLVATQGPLIEAVAVVTAFQLWYYRRLRWL